MPVGAGGRSKVLSKQHEKRLTPYIDSNAALGVFIEKEGNCILLMEVTKHFFVHLMEVCRENGVVIMINGENFSVINECLTVYCL
jgi:hypothetical protein